ncbi:hypothetical protein POM88_025726 [Heracleum sosnowskyi]|uniref:Uncharacterized protein n=1 Tax=Heracleum sosnowskyi TaxID=360622 RepID=A0AAD8I4H7_9APIA|nr:hypothetical protein POM88_025726 [Heracleum sosnowskyi]
MTPPTTEIKATDSLKTAHPPLNERILSSMTRRSVAAHPWHDLEIEHLEKTTTEVEIPVHDPIDFDKLHPLANLPKFEIRQLNLKGARSILGQAIGKAPKDKIFKKYIEIELQLGNIDRCRKLYEKYLEWSPENCYAWSKYAELERSLSVTDRARAIFELTIAQPQEALFCYRIK